MSDTGTAIQVVSGKKKLAKSLVSSFGKGARNKFIQQDILYCSEEELYELLKGYYYGDGSIVKSKDGKIRIKCAGVSESLMYSIFLILIKLGYNPRLDRRKTCDVIQGRKVNASKWIYCVDLSIKEEVAKFAKEVYDIKFNLKKKYSKDEKKKFVEECGKSGNITAFCKKKGIIFQNYYAWKKNKRIKEEFVRKKGFILVPITEISINNYNSPVYNIEVNDVHKYICNGILINNCVVPKIEGNIYSRDWIKDINLKFKKIIFMDNNWLAKDKKDWLKDIKLLKELKKKGIREVDFNQSLDCREITEWHFKQMKGIPITPIRFSFDHMGQDKFAQKAIELSHKYGFRKITFDVLYNWNDTVDDFYYRLREINKRIATAVPMRYCPIDRTDKEYVGKNWTKKERDAINKINPYQKGQLSAKGNMDEFDYFYGKDVKEFKRLLNFKNINKLTNLKMKRFSRRKIK